MAHCRTQIRNAIKALLLPLPALGGRVFTSRFSNLQLAEVPAVVIYGGEENVLSADIHDTLLERDYNVNVSIKATSVSNIDTLLDDLAEDVELAIDANLTLDGKVQSIVLTGSNIQIDEDAEVPVGEALLQYQVKYFTQVGAPDQFS